MYSVSESFSYIETLDKLILGRPVSPEELQQLLAVEKLITARIDELKNN